MGSYQSTTEVTDNTPDPAEVERSNIVMQSVNAYKCAVQMAKKEKNSEGIIELVNRNIIPINSTKEEYNQVIDILNELMLTMAENGDNNPDEVLSLDRIIRSIIYDRDNGPVEEEVETSEGEE